MLEHIQNIVVMSVKYLFPRKFFSKMRHHLDQLLGGESRALIDLRHLTENVDSGLVDRIGYQNFRHQWGAALPR